MLEPDACTESTMTKAEGRTLPERLYGRTLYSTEGCVAWNCVAWNCVASAACAVCSDVFSLPPPRILSANVIYFTVFCACTVNRFPVKPACFVASRAALMCTTVVYVGASVRSACFSYLCPGKRHP